MYSLHRKPSVVIFFRQVKSHPDCHRQRPRRLWARHTGTPQTSPQAPTVSGSGRHVKYRAVAGAHGPQPNDPTLKKMSPDGLSTCQRDCAPFSMFQPWTYSMGAVGFQWLLPLPRVASAVKSSAVKTLTIGQLFWYK
jgi:hypothetical protein